MSEARVGKLIRELVAEIEGTPSLDKSVLDSAKKLESGIEALVDPEIDTSENTILDDAIALEASFAATHPTAAKIMRELVDSLSRIGI
jgi:hypothetical protein